MRRALLRFLRATHLIGLADAVRALRAAAQHRAENTSYRSDNSDRAFPDPLLVHEVAGHASLPLFDRSGAAHATRIAALLRQSGLPPAPSILEWGCGPARILAHLPAALADEDARYCGCDPDARAIDFARRAHPTITLTRIAFDPPTPYHDQAFDAIYGVSIFTHLDEEAATTWVAELARLLNDDGIVLVTSHGEAAAERLDSPSRQKFAGGRYLALGGARLGSRTYVSYFNEAAGRVLFGKCFGEIDFLPAANSGLGQDAWLLRRPRRA